MYNKLNHFKCLKINIDLLKYDHFCNKLQDSTNTNGINKWKHNEKRTIIVTFTIPENKDHCLLNQNKMEALFKQLFAKDVELICHTKIQPKLRGP